MPYQAFYNKYRPQTFEEVVGQKAVVETLKNAIREDKIAHAYLFCGPRGTGKTTMARLFAKALNCKEGLGKQCCACDSCEAIARGDHPDVIEIDAASNSNVESVRQLIDNVSYQPILSRYKIYIIDEVHNMSNSAFNALLKTLEEPPSFVVFILATTEPQKIIPTILSRVQRFDFAKVNVDDLVTNMKRILDAEKIPYEKEALPLLASLSDGGVRDSLSLLDKLVSYSGDKVTVANANELFGLLSLHDEIALLKNIKAKKADECLKDVRLRYQKGMDVIRLHSDLITLYKDLIIFRTTHDASLLEKLSPEDTKAFPQPLSELNQDIQKLIESKRDYRTSDNVLSHFELSLLALMEEPPTASLTPTPVSVPVKSAPKEEEKVLATVPVPIEASHPTASFVADVAVKDTSDEKISYTMADIVNLMKRASSKEVRVAISEKWNALESFFTSDKAFEAKALSNMKLRVLADDILLLTTKMTGEIDKINSKKEQPALQYLMKNAFGKAYRVLPIPEREFRDAFLAFKTEKDTPSTIPTIDFGENKNLSASTAFMDEILNGK